MLVNFIHDCVWKLNEGGEDELPEGEEIADVDNKGAWDWWTSNPVAVGVKDLQSWDRILGQDCEAFVVLITSQRGLITSSVVEVLLTVWIAIPTCSSPGTG